MSRVGQPGETERLRDIHPLLCEGRWYAGLPTALQEDLLHHGQSVWLDPGQRLFARGDPPCGLYAVLQGAIRITGLGLQGKEAILTLLEPPHWFGEIALFDEDVRTHDAMAESRSQLWKIPQRAMHQLLQRQPEYWPLLGRLLTQKLRLAFLALEDASLFPAPQRVARRLLLMAASPLNRPDVVRYTLELPQDVLGAMLGISRQTTNQILRDMEARGLIRLGRAQIELLDLAGLQTWAERPGG